MMDAELDADSILDTDARADVFLLKPQTVKAIRMTEPFFLHTINGKQVGKTGDWLVIAQDGYRSIMTDAQFQKHYCLNLESQCLGA